MTGGKKFGLEKEKIKHYILRLQVCKHPVNSRNTTMGRLLHGEQSRHFSSALFLRQTCIERMVKISYLDAFDIYRVIKVTAKVGIIHEHFFSLF